MDVRCERCKTEYELDDTRVTEAGIPVKCATCGYVFRVKKKALIVTVPLAPGEATEGAATLTPVTTVEKPKEWRIRQSQGTVVVLRELTTLQRWIVERKVFREDEISVTGESWKRLGDIPELHPFFQVLDEALQAQRVPVPLPLTEPVREPVRAPTPLATPVVEAPPPAAVPQAWATATSSSTGTGVRTVSGERPAAPAFTRATDGLMPLDSDALAAVGRRPGRRPSRDDLELVEPAPDFTYRRRRSGVFFLLVALALFGMALAYVLRPEWFRVGTPPDGELVTQVPPGRSGPPPRPTPPRASSADEPVPGALRSTELQAAPPSGAEPPAAAGVTDAGEAASPGVQAPVPLPAEVAAANAPPAKPGEEVVGPPGPLPRRTPTPRDYDSFMAQGDRLRERDRTRAALDAYGKAVELAPTRAEGYAGRGLALLDMGQRPQAEASFQQALKLNPKYGVAIMGLAETYRVMNKKEDAIRYYQRYLEVAPSGMEAAAARAAIQKLRE